jgi:hypothetical protein
VFAAKTFAATKAGVHLVEVVFRELTFARRECMAALRSELAEAPATLLDP